MNSGLKLMDNWATELYKRNSCDLSAKTKNPTILRLFFFFCRVYN